MRTLGVFTTSRGETLRRGSQVIARTDRGLELGEVLCEATEQAMAQIHDPSRGQVLREATVEDQNEIMRMRSMTRQEFEKCRSMISELKLQMELVDVEHLFGGERIIFYYLAENRVDFRELVKVLATEFQTRIEMRQIGVRDEAKLLADYGDCGKPVCCNTHLNEMPPVSMKMAKLQRATLDPTKISGRCGRLKCCLRYEYDTYVDLQKELPQIGSQVLTKNGKMKILGHEILASQLLVETEDRRRMLIPAAEVISILATAAQMRKAQADKRKEEEDARAGEGARPPEPPAGDRPERPRRDRDRGPRPPRRDEPREPRGEAPPPGDAPPGEPGPPSGEPQASDAPEPAAEDARQDPPAVESPPETPAPANDTPSE